jgi:hypothetical protein
MPIKTINQSSTGKTFKLGRKRPVARCPRLRLERYLKASMPMPPPTCDYRPKAANALSEMYLNDQLGDCVIAGIAHITGVLTGNADPQPLIFDDSEIVELYSAISGYVPGDESTDNGCDEETALNYWVANGAPKGTAHKIISFLEVDPTNVVEIQTALWLFENLVYGVELPDVWVNPAPAASGFTWGVNGDPDPNNGHCFIACGYNPTGVLISTWGMTGTITYSATAKYAGGEGGQLFVVLDDDLIESAVGVSPTGFNWSQLSADFDAIQSGFTARGV